MTAALLLLALFHLKITYFGAALAETAAALVIAPHVGRRAERWVVAVGLVVAHALAPWNAPYRADILAAVGTGAANTGLVGFLLRLFDNLVELCLLTIGLMIATWLWRSGRARVGLPLAAAFLVWHALRYAFVTDDAYISFVYARNLAEHGELVFNPGRPPVEGYTNFLWTVLLAGADLVGLRLETAALVLGATFAIGTLVVVARLTAHLLEGEVAGRAMWIAVAPAWLALSASYFLLKRGTVARE